MICRTTEIFRYYLEKTAERVVTRGICVHFITHLAYCVIITNIARQLYDYYAVYVYTNFDLYPV